MERRYQLIIRFAAHDVVTAEPALAFERRLGEALCGVAHAETVVRGWTGDAVDVLVRTDAPDEVWDLVRGAADALNVSDRMCVASRAVDANDWTVRWPPGVTRFDEPTFDWGFRVTLELPFGGGPDAHALSSALDDVAARVRGAFHDVDAAECGSPSLAYDDAGRPVVRIEIMTAAPDAVLRRLRHVLAEGTPPGGFRVSYTRARGGPRAMLHDATTEPPRSSSSRHAARAFQLVIQFTATGTDLQALRRLTDLEQRVDEIVSAAGDAVDGHDNGCGEMNLFIQTATPYETFEQIQPLIGELGPKPTYRAAYRDLDGDTYTVLWPSGLTTFSVA